MSKQRLIDAERLKRHYSWWTGPMELTREDLDTIVDMQPDATPAWIPVSEQLPNNDNLVLVSCQAKNGNRSVNRAYFDGQFWHGSGSMSGVVAWMPLPEPYREERTEE